MHCRARGRTHRGTEVPHKSTVPRAGAYAQKHRCAGAHAPVRMQEELDEICEAYLEDRFDVKIDFAIEDSLPRLLRDGLVEPAAEASDPRLRAVPMEVAYERLLEKWKRRASPPRSACGAVPPSAMPRTARVGAPCTLCLARIPCTCMACVPRAADVRAGAAPLACSEARVAAC
jgi:hypothetical protein